MFWNDWNRMKYWKPYEIFKCFFSGFSFINGVCGEDAENVHGMFVLKVKENGTRGMFRYLQEYNLTEMFQVKI